MRGEHTPDEITQRRLKLGGGGKNSEGGRDQSELVADFNRIGWPTSIGISGRLQSYWVADLVRNPHVMW